MKQYTILALAAAMAGALAANAANSYGLPEQIQDGNILHCFNWTAAQVKEELPAIADAGFGAVQLSPMQGSCAAGAEWYYAYLPKDMKFGTMGVGTRIDLKELCAEAEKYGIKIVLDVVANHINGRQSDRAARWNDTELWHSATFKNVNYSNRNSITHDNLGDYPDLNSEHPTVRQAVAEFVATIKAQGVKGIRWDAAKHIGLPSEGCDFWPEVCDPELWHYGEILDGPGSSNSDALMCEYAKYMSVTDSQYSNTLLTAIKNGKQTNNVGYYAKRDIEPTSLVYWGESHDLYANEGGATKNISQDKIDRAWALGACRQGAVGLYLSRPAKTGYTEIKMGVKGSTHFTAPEIAAVNKLRNAMGRSAEAIKGVDGVTVVTRAGGGACIVVGNGTERAVEIENAGGLMPAGSYTDEVTGNIFTVTASTISGTVGPTGIAVIIDPNASGINAPVADNSRAAVVYYNMQGIAVDSSCLSPGIYVRRQGSTATKIMVK